MATLAAFLSYCAALYLTTCAPGTATKPTDLTTAFSQLRACDSLLAHLQTGQLMLVYKWLPGPFGLPMLLSFATLIIVSLLTKPEDGTRMEAFFDRMRRSTGLENLPADQPKPLAAKRVQGLILLDVGKWFTGARWRRIVPSLPRRPHRFPARLGYDRTGCPACVVGSSNRQVYRTTSHPKTFADTIRNSANARHLAQTVLPLWRNSASALPALFLRSAFAGTLSGGHTGNTEAERAVV